MFWMQEDADVREALDYVSDASLAYPPSFLLIIQCLLHKLNIIDDNKQSSSQILFELPQLPPLARYNPLEHKSIYNYAFHTSNTELGCLTSKTSTVLVLPILVFFLAKVKFTLCPIFSKLGYSMAEKRHGIQWLKNPQNQERLLKFGEYCYRLLFHSLIALFGILYFHDKPWWDLANFGSKYIWIGYPLQTIEPGMAWYYLIQSAYNINELWYLFYISFKVDRYNKFPFVKIQYSETKRGDFTEMMVHHLVTNSLIFTSSHFRFTIIGSMIFFVHDISDVPVDLSKLANFMKMKVLTVLFFMMLLVFWLVFRLGILPFVLLYSVLHESPLTVTKGEAGMSVPCYLVMVNFFTLLIGLLVALHVFWFIILVRILIVLSMKGETHDLSEHKKGEKQN